MTWFDVAPPYGAGEAEAILGEFLAGRRASVRLCTKVGLAGPERSGLMLAARLSAAARLAARFSPACAANSAPPRRRAIARSRSTPASTPASLDRSLARLRTDHVDVFALHAPSPADTVRDDVIRALEDILASGKARQVCVAGGLRRLPGGCGGRSALPRPATRRRSRDGAAGRASRRRRAASSRPSPIRCSVSTAPSAGSSPASKPIRRPACASRRQL